MIECVGVSNCVHFFPFNPIKEQFQLRHSVCVKELGWKDGLTAYQGMEADDYDKPGTKYLVKRCPSSGIVLGVTRLFPTITEHTQHNEIGRFMISESFPFLVDDKIPSGKYTFEASRMVVNPILRKNRTLRRSVVNELVLAYKEFALKEKIESYIALMNPHYWKVFERLGWEVDYLGKAQDIGGGDIVRVGRLWVCKRIHKKMQELSNIYDPILNFGMEPSQAKRRIEEIAFTKVRQALEEAKPNILSPSTVNDNHETSSIQYRQ
ncbi:MAG: acyl-homoserine-lactone synthase [Alphaproteobacteria bacterium]